MKYLLLIFLFDLVIKQPVNPLMPPPIIRIKQASDSFIALPVPKEITMFWPDEQDTTAWIVVESDNPAGPFIYYTFTTRPWITISLTNNQHFFNYCRSQDYNP